MTEVSTHRTALVPIAITCPTWCDVTPEEHRNDLWNLDGCCHHWMEPVAVEDTVGYGRALTEPIFFDPMRVVLVSTTNPQGNETNSPVLHLGIHGQELSVSQALDLADELRRQVGLYRSTGGTA